MSTTSELKRIGSLKIEDKGTILLGLFLVLFFVALVASIAQPFGRAAADKVMGGARKAQTAIAGGGGSDPDMEGL